MDANRRVLVCDERINGWCLTKFPGGGLEFGEGLVDCVKREFMEELALELSEVEHFYTTDFFQPSAFNAAHQIISVYYLVKPLQDAYIKTSDKLFDFPEGSEDALSARWVEWADLHPDGLTLPIDKLIIHKLKK